MTQVEAEALHRQCPIVVGHDHWTDEAHLLELRAAGIAAKVLHVCVDADVWDGPEAMQRSQHEYTGWSRRALIEIERVLRIIDSHPDKLVLARSATEVLATHAAGRSALILGFEGGKPVERDLELLGAFHRLGLRVMQLTWAGGNDICDRRDPPAHEGLTAFGREVVAEMNRLGILVDIGHSSRKTFDETVELSRKPVVSLHAIPSGSKAGAGDLDDEQVRALAQTGGLVGLHFFSHYLNSVRKASVEDLVDHLDYVVELVGIEYVALGADYFDLTEKFREGHGMPASGFLGIPEDLDSYGKLVNVTTAMARRGYEAEQISAVLGGNLLRVLRQTCGS
jgi:membrane dipeptidase